MSVTNPEGEITTSTYYPDGQLHTVEDPLSHVTTYTYDKADRQVAVKDARGYLTTTTYYPDGQVEATIDPLDHRTTYTYDKADRQTQVQNARGFVATTTYLANGLVSATYDELGHRTSYTYDKAGRQTRVENALGQVTTTTYYPDGQVEATINPLGHRTTTIYDAANRPTEVIDGEGQRTTTVYDRAGRAVTTLNAEGHRTTTVYDNADRQTALVDANDHRTTFQYDAAGRNTLKIDPLDRRTTYGYDEVGNQTLTWDARDVRVTMTYDQVNQPTEKHFSDGTRHTSSYDPVGNRTVIIDPTGRTTSVYDGRNSTTSVTNPDGKRVTYGYDPVGSRTTMTDPDGGRFTYTYDEKGRLKHLVNPQNEATTFVYDAVDRTTRKELANDNLSTYVYDDAGRLTELTHSTSGGGLISRFTYTYDRAGNRTLGVQDNGSETFSTTWTYDKTYQLTREQRDGTNSFDTTYTYDPVGNRLTMADQDDGVTTYTYDAANELKTEEIPDGTVTTYSYDAAGNRTEKDVDGAITSYAWDAAGRMSVADPPLGELVSLTYNADGQRVRKTTAGDDKKFIYDFNRLLQETDAADQTEMEYTSTVEEYGDLVSEYDPRDGGSTAYHQYDVLGSTDALLDPDDANTKRYAYRAFGQIEWESAQGPSTQFTFVGRANYYQDSEIELYYLGAGAAGRPYDPATGQFISRDPAEWDDNPYRYVGNNPVNATDPSGLQAPAPSPPPTPSTAPRVRPPDEAQEVIGYYYSAGKRKPVYDFPYSVSFWVGRAYYQKEKGAQWWSCPCEIAVGSREGGQACQWVVLHVEQERLTEPPPWLGALPEPAPGELPELEPIAYPAELRWRRIEEICPPPTRIPPMVRRPGRASIPEQLAKAAGADAEPRAVTAQDVVREIVDWGTALTPVVSDIRDWQEVITGYDVINQRKLTVVERIVAGVAALVPFVGAAALRKVWRLGTKLVGLLIYGLGKALHKAWQWLKKAWGWLRRLFRPKRISKEAGEKLMKEATDAVGRRLDDILADDELFARWLKHAHPSHRALSVSDSRKVWDKLKQMGLKPKFHSGHPGTKWAVPHISVNGKHIPVDPGFVPP